ncbi:Asp-tRNA(Asn)/Glu-tRNA(Gln) amidotransferase A subunit family amidase [Algoriphagus boseongensis]|uniref:Asp-tRNA(Asn)/Glu-tRNA(Gln) amidotransferase A subunit family amidase n=1 Tax=Algoriphagus boseongensis TaxID=1442587 RepID=A0A4R6TB45_9BACT|nr:amidase [Algoriphagus boseongensis]TDQ18875.1 Asp-tRNA(Asn)/Glu-tRNA(Gln) amidotransferase A subunit family amidase [Algoriphagus boseongensis]
MRKVFKFSFLFLFGLLIYGCRSNPYGFTKKDITHAQKLIGIEFDKSRIETMEGYLSRNKLGYDSMRMYPISNETFPAVQFDPHPKGFEFPKFLEAPTFSIPKDIDLPEDRNQLAFYTIPQLASLIQNKKISFLELTEFFIARIKKYDNQLHSVITLTEELAITQAKKADEELAAGKVRGILHGIPYGIKDLFSVPGYPTTWGAMPYKDQEFEETATVVRKLEEQGAVLVAKLVSGALARGDVWFGGRTLNPWDLTQGATGSSAGSGAATSAGLVPFAIGTETLGSITSPSARTGITGLRPTYGRVSRFGAMSLSWSMDKIGPMARTAEDCAIIFQAIYGKDSGDPSTNAVGFQFSPKEAKSLKLAYLKKDIEKDTTDSGKNLQASLEVFKSIGYELVPIELPENFPYGVFDIILRAEAGAFFDELVRSGEVDLMVEQDEGSRANSLRQSRFIPAVEYIQANRVRTQLIEDIHALFKDFDVIIAPPNRGRQLLITNLTGHPALSIPNGLDQKGRPTSLTLLGNLYQEGKILELAKAYQDATDFEEKLPPLFSK